MGGGRGVALKRRPDLANVIEDIAEFLMLHAASAARMVGRAV
jgi:hypothetical protein